MSRRCAWGAHDDGIIVGQTLAGVSICSDCVPLAGLAVYAPEARTTVILLDGVAYVDDDGPEMDYDE